MSFDEMLETWRDVDREALRQALQTEESKVRRSHLSERRGLWFFWIFGTGIAVWAGFWIAITITNGWPAFYAILSGVCLSLFVLALGAPAVDHLHTVGTGDDGWHAAVLLDPKHESAARDPRR
jgi:hypothetical protein